MPNIVTTLVCPLLGVLISNAMAFSPTKAVLEARKQKNLGDLNPLPFALIVCSQMGWTIYGVMTRDYFVFLSSCFGLLFGFVLCLTAIHILERPKHGADEEALRLRLEGILLGGSSFWIFIVFITGIVIPYSQIAVSQKIVGAFSDIFSLIFYAAPLSHMQEIIKTKNSATLYAPSIVINLLNCALWFTYGLFGIQSVPVWLPNIMGALISIAELTLCVLYPAHKHAPLSADVEAGSVDNPMQKSEETQTSTKA